MSGHRISYKKIPELLFWELILVCGVLSVLYALCQNRWVVLYSTLAVTIVAILDGILFFMMSPRELRLPRHKGWKTRSRQVQKTKTIFAIREYGKRGLLISLPYYYHSFRGEQLSERTVILQTRGWIVTGNENAHTFEIVLTSVCS